MTNHSATPVHFPPTTTNTPPRVIQPIGIPAEPAHLSSILACVITQPVDRFAEAFGPFDEKPVATVPTDKPPHSAAYLQRANLILIQSDGVIECSFAYCEAMQRARCESWLFGARADQLIPAHKASSMTSATAKALGLLPSDPHKSPLRPIGRYKVISLVNATGEVWIKDRTIAALYKATLQTVKRLTRGRR